MCGAHELIWRSGDRLAELEAKLATARCRAETPGSLFRSFARPLIPVLEREIEIERTIVKWSEVNYG